MIIYGPGLVLLVYALARVAGLIGDDGVVVFLICEAVSVAAYIWMIQRRLRNRD